MALRSIRNHRNFFSDYWLSSLLTTRGLPGPRLNAQLQRRKLATLSRLMEVVDRPGALDPSRFRERFARPLLEDVLDFGVAEPEGDADGSLLQVTSGSLPLEQRRNHAPLALIRLSTQPGDHETLGVRRNLERALHDAGVDHGFIITPDTLRLIKRPGTGPRGAAFDVALATMDESEDIESLVAAFRILSAEAFIRNGDGRRPIDVLEAESREHSARVSNDLKASVFEAAERIVAAFLRDVRSRPDAFTDAPSILALRDAGFLALYRLLFILYAEARDERLSAHPLYRQSYSLDSLVSRLAVTPLEAQAGNRFRIWAHVLALFRVFNEGVAAHLPDLENIPPRGGRLFSDTTPDGSLLRRLQVDDRTCAQLLLGLATTRPRRGIGRERVSFRELAIEQLGAVYEGLLEYEPTEAAELRIAVRAQSGSELALTPSEIVFLCDHKGLTVAGDARLVEGTEAAYLHPENAADDENGAESEDEEVDEDESDDSEAVELKAGGRLRLLRRLEPGSFYFRPGGARKASGSFYTPTAMVDDLVREALGPLTDGKTSAEIEALRVIDPACGSAHFLVGAARFLGGKLHEAYRAECGVAPPEAFIPAGTPDTRRQSQWRERWNTEGRAWCVRRIVERCLYGVDYNPAAVQLAQVSLWIESLAGDRPLSFFAHHIRVGNSLLGTWADRFDAPPDPQLAEGRDRATRGLFEASIRDRILAALEERRLIDAELPPEVRADTPEEYAYKEDRLRRAEAALTDARLLLDLRSASSFLPAIWRDLPAISEAADVKQGARARAWWHDFVKLRERERFFHWELEFPEVMLRPDRPGFDAVLGNPPWDKVRPTRQEFYAAIDPLIRAFKGNELDARVRELNRNQAGLANEYDRYAERLLVIARVLRGGGDFPLARARSQSANEDLAKYFVDRALRIVRDGGAAGIVVPSVVYNGDGCLGIREFLLRRAAITRFYCFENRRKIFPIDSRYKFANLVARRGMEQRDGFDAAFMRHDLRELSDAGSKPWMVRITLDEIEQLSPDTFAFLEYRGPRDQEIVRKMSQDRPLFGGTGRQAWGTRLFSWRAHETVFHTTNDKDLFTIPGANRLHSPESVLGTVPQDTSELYDAMGARGFWPVMEGKHIDQYLVGTKPVRWWLSLEQAERKYDRPPRDVETLVFRETARNTDERTCIAAVLPAKTAASHTLTGATFDHVTANAAATVLNSFCFDFALRLRAAGTHVSFTYILPVAVPSAAVVNQLPTIPTRGSWEAGITHTAEDQALWPALWATNKAVAIAYGLDASDLRHIMSAFPVFRRKRPGLSAFLDGRLAEWQAGA